MLKSHTVLQLQHDFIVSYSRHFIFYYYGCVVNQPVYPLFLGVSYASVALLRRLSEFESPPPFMDINVYQHHNPVTICAANS